MKQWLILLFLLIAIACRQQIDPLVGIWKVNSSFYSATYQIMKKRNQLNGLVLFYNDGTTRYKHDGTQQQYIFNGLKKKEDGQYVDGISGATTKNDTPKNIEIKIINKDTLEVTTFVMNKPLVEFWTRQNNEITP